MRNFLTIIFLFSFIAVSSQKNPAKKGDNLFKIYYFDKAIKQYQQADSLSLVAQKNLAESYYNRFNFAQAEIEYAKFIETPIANLADYYKYILILKANGKYDEIGDWIDKMAKLKPEDLRVKSYVETNATFDKLLEINPKYTIYNLKFNSREDDFSPSYFRKEQIVFTSTRTRFKPILRRYNWNREPFLDIFVANVNDSNQFEKIKYLNKKFNKKWHEGPTSFNSTGKFLAFTKNNYYAMSEDDIVKLQIFFSEFKKGEWTEPESFEYNSDEYSVGHPALTRNGRIMFFSSDMPGGYGGTDIYMVTKVSKNNWSKPINLGPTVNTEGDEMFPFYEDRNKLLFYASNGMHGLGGLDVYVAHATTDGFEEVKNLGAPINTSADDFSFIIDRKLKTGYFSSNRSTGKGGDDIYRFDYKGRYDMKRKIEEIPVDTTELVDAVDSVIIELNDSIIKYSYNLLVLNDQSKLPIKNAEVKIGRLLAKKTDSLGVTQAKFANADSFKVVVNAFGYQPTEKIISLDKKSIKDILKDTVNLKVAVNQRIVLKNIYYDFDKSNILPESQKELDELVKFMNENPTLKVELSSHTDSRGSHRYNIALSQRRANSAVRYVVWRGIDKDRIVAKGYGETRLVNGCSDGVYCKESKHRQNRRTEIFIPGFGKADDIEQTKGKYSGR